MMYICSIKTTKHIFSLFLFILIFFVIFYPLFEGKNFLPFSSYEPYRWITEQSNNQKLKDDKLFDITRKTRNYGIREIDYSGISILYSMQLFTAENFKKGILPLWDPYIGCGVPTFGEGQFKPFNPFFIPFYFFTNSNVYSICILLELIVGFIFMVLFLKKVDIPYELSILGGLIFILNPFIENRLSFTDHLQSYIFLPLILLAIENLDKLNLISLLKTSIPFIIIGHIGHPEMAVIVTLISVVYFLVMKKNPFMQKIYFLISLGFLVLLSLSLYIFPLLQNYFKGVSYKEGVSRLYVHTAWWDVFVPSSDMNILPFILLLSILGTLIFSKRSNFFFLLGLFSLIYSVKVPFFGSFLTNSGFTFFLPCYFKMIFWFSVAILASYGFKYFLEKRNFILELSLFLSSFALMAICPYFLSFPLGKFFDGYFLFYIFSFIPVIFILLKLTKKGIDRGKHNIVISFVFLFALLPYVYPLSKNLIMWNDCDIKSYDTLNFIKKQNQNGRVASPSIMKKSCLPPNYGSALGIRQVEINTFIFPDNYYPVLKKYSPFPTLIEFNKKDDAILKKLGVSFIILPKEYVNLENELLFKGQFSYLYKMESERAFFAKDLIPIKSLKEVSYDSLVKVDSESVYVEGIGEKDKVFQREGNYSLKFVEDSLHKVSIDVESEKDSFLVLRDTYDTDWKCFIDGKDAKSYRVDGMFRGVFVSAGKHKVEWIYKPIVFYISLVVSVLFHIFIIVALIFQGKSFRR